MKYEIEEKIRAKLSEIEEKEATDFNEGWAEALEWVLSELESNTVTAEPSDWILVKKDSITIIPKPTEKNILEKTVEITEMLKEPVEFGDVQLIIETHIKGIRAYDFLEDLSAGLNTLLKLMKIPEGD